MSKTIIHDINNNDNVNNNDTTNQITINNKIHRSKSVKDINNEIDLMTNQTGNINLNRTHEDLSDKNVKSNKNITIDDFKETINKNEYIKNCSSNEEISNDSLSYLVKDMNLSQSDKIKLGTGMEKILSDFIVNCNEDLKIIKNEKKNKKGDKEKDHIFKDEKNKIIHYAELKSNLNLDTEKSKSTSQKCLLIEKELKEKYIGYTIKMYLVNLRYLVKKDIPELILNKYQNIPENICGLNEYLSNLGINYNFKDENEYKILLRHLVKKMFKKND